MLNFFEGVYLVIQWTTVERKVTDVWRPYLPETKGSTGDFCRLLFACHARNATTVLSGSCAIAK